MRMRGIGRRLFSSSVPGGDGAPALDSLGPLAFKPARETRWARVRRQLRRAQVRWRLIVTIASGGTFLAALACLWAAPRYTATAVVVIRTDGEEARRAGLEELAWLAQQIAVLDGRSLAAEVIRTLGLERDMRFVATLETPALRRMLGSLRRHLRGRKPAAVDDVVAEDNENPADADVAADVPPALVRAYRGALAIKARRTGRVDVSFTSPSAALAQQIANAHATAYLRRSLQARFAPTGAARALLEREAGRAREERATTADALAAFKRTHREVGPTAKEEETLLRLTDVARRLGDAEATRISAEADTQLVKAHAYDALPAVAADPLIRTLRADVERAHQAMLADGGTLREATAQLRQARTRLEREIRRALAGIESTFLDAQGREAGLRAQLDREQRALDPASDMSAYIRLILTATSAEALDEKLRSRIDESTMAAGAGADGSTLEPAALPRRPSEPRVGRALACGTLLAGLLGTLLAIVLERGPRVIGTPDDVRRMLRIPTLGVVPDFARVGRAGVAAEVYRALRTSLLFLSPEKPPRTILVTSGHAGEGKTATTVNLGFSLASLGMRVVVVDAAFRDPAVHRAVGMPAGPGLAELMTGDAPLEKCLRTVPVAGGGSLGVIAAGNASEPAAGLLASPRLRSLLTTLGERFEVVLFDSAAVLQPGGSGALLAPLVDAVMVVVPAGVVEPAVAKAALDRLRGGKGHPIGVVLNRVDPAVGYYRTYAYPFAA